MNLKKLILCATVGCAMVAGVANADIRLSYPLDLKTTGDVCNHFTGRWNGDGDISADVLFSTMHCHYTGTVDVNPAGNAYNVHVNVSSHSDWPCPNNETLDLSATCKNGAIVVNSDKANLNGHIAPSGNAADLTGTIKFSVGSSDINADVDRLHLQR